MNFSRAKRVRQHAGIGFGSIDETANGLYPAGFFRGQPLIDAGLSALEQSGSDHRERHRAWLMAAVAEYMLQKFCHKRFW
jgi:hypothetical protein